MWIISIWCLTWPHDTELVIQTAKNCLGNIIPFTFSIANPLGSSSIKRVELVKVKWELFLSPRHDFFAATSPSQQPLLPIFSFFFSHAFFPPSLPSFSHFFSMTPLCLGVDRVLCACKYVPSVLLHDWEIGFLPKLFPVLSHPHSHFRCHPLPFFFYPPIFLSPLHNPFFSLAYSPSVSYAAARLID